MCGPGSGVLALWHLRPRHRPQVRLLRGGAGGASRRGGLPNCQLPAQLWCCAAGANYITRDLQLVGGEWQFGAACGLVNPPAGAQFQDCSSTQRQSVLPASLHCTPALRLSPIAVFRPRGHGPWGQEPQATSQRAPRPPRTHACCILFLPAWWWWRRRDDRWSRVRRRRWGQLVFLAARCGSWPFLGDGLRGPLPVAQGPPQASGPGSGRAGLLVLLLLVSPVLCF